MFEIFNSVLGKTWSLSKSHFGKERFWLNGLNAVLLGLFLVTCSCCSTNPCMNWQSIWHCRPLIKNKHQKTVFNTSEHPKGIQKSFKVPNSRNRCLQFPWKQRCPRAKPSIQQNHQGLRRYAGDGVYSRLSRHGICWFFSLPLCLSCFSSFLLALTPICSRQFGDVSEDSRVAREHWGCCLPLDKSVRHSSRAYMMHQMDDIFEGMLW